MKKLLLSLTNLPFYILGTISSAYAQEIKLVPEGTGVVIDPTNLTIAKVITFVINLLIVVGVVAALVYLLYGGFKWITSGGEKGQVESARNHVVAAIVGLIIMILAWLIISLILQVLGLGSLTKITLPSLK